MEKYLSHIDKNGLKKTWHSILSRTLNNKFDSDLFKYSTMIDPKLIKHDGDKVL